METSAKSSYNIEEAFINLARDIKTKMEQKMVNYFPFNSVVFEHSGYILNMNTNLTLYSNRRSKQVLQKVAANYV